MSATIIDGREISKKIREIIKNQVKAFDEELNLRPGLAALMAGEDPASVSYIKSIEKLCANAGIDFFWHKLNANASESEILGEIDELNKDNNVSGIIVQLPLPKGVDVKKISHSILPEKDVDCFSPINTGKLFLGEKVLLPCTPKGIVRLIEEIGIETAGKKTVVVGRSNIVGKPVALLMLQKNCTVTVCHSKTQDLKKEVFDADIVVAATGKPGLITGEMIKHGAVVIDAGVSEVDGKLVGDVVFEEAKEIASYITPVPGGVGPMTTTMLLENTMEAFKNAHKDIISK
ncbi:MAG: bifunctional methylenetetrahydrofolate dehydrogenase/methenyltetrahydrofolate cyclohydrolase FolD [Thermoanaerobacteraceae bacterium]|nr:bifunctional methylenetetrahydrofolate dehydrogenase/methenyltetrahydrofolate cyclohydrolase FolD [Thermoanaerobacteraceae bacterium]